MAGTTIHCCGNPKCPARGRNFTVMARGEDHEAADGSVPCPVCGQLSDFIRNETARLRWLTVAGSLIIGVLSMEAAARAGVEWGPAIAFGIIGFAISMLLLGMFDWLKHL